MDWRAFDVLEPIGAYREDYMIGQLTAVVYNLAQSIYGSKDAPKKALRAEDFIPWMDSPGDRKEEPQRSRGLSSPEDIKELFLSLKRQQDKKKGEEITDG